MTKSINTCTQQERGLQLPCGLTPFFHPSHQPFGQCHLCLGQNSSSQTDCPTCYSTLEIPLMIHTVFYQGEASLKSIIKLTTKTNYLRKKGGLTSRGCVSGQGKGTLLHLFRVLLYRIGLRDTLNFRGFMYSLAVYKKNLQHIYWIPNHICNQYYHLSLSDWRVSNLGSKKIIALTGISHCRQTPLNLCFTTLLCVCFSLFFLLFGSDFYLLHFSLFSLKPVHFSIAIIVTVHIYWTQKGCFV